MRRKLLLPIAALLLFCAGVASTAVWQQITHASALCEDALARRRQAEGVSLRESIGSQNTSDLLTMARRSVASFC